MAREKVDNKLNVVIGTKAQIEGDTSIPENSIVVVTDEVINADEIVYSVEKNVKEAIDDLETSKQDKLVAGTNITINPDTNVISSSGDVGGTVDWEDVKNKPELYDKSEVLNKYEIGLIVEGAIETVETADTQLSNRIDDVEDVVISLDDVKQDKLTAGDNITINPTTNVISASGGNGGGGGGEVDLNEMAYFNYAGNIYGAKYNLLANAWEHSLTVDPLEISQNSSYGNYRGIAQYPNGEIEGIIIPNSVTDIGDHAFNRLTSNNQPLVIPGSVTSIGDYAFYGWFSNNQPLVIPNSVTSIGVEAFFGWSSNNQPLGIPNSVTSIGDGAFSNWVSNNQPLGIPNSVTSIGGYAFSDWSSAKEFIMESETPPTILRDSFANTNNAPFYVPNDSVEAYKTATNWVGLADRIFPISDR